MIKLINNFIVFQAAAFIASLLATILIIRSLGSSEYGYFSFYVVIADFLRTAVVLGVDQSITHFKSRRSNIDLHNVAIFNAKLIVFLTLLPFVFFIHDNYVIASLSMLMLSGLIDFSYLHMEKASLVNLAKATLFSRLLYLLIIFELTRNHSPYQFYFMAFGIINIILSIVIMSNNNQVKSLKFDLIAGFAVLREALSVGFSRIFLFSEALVVIFIFKQSLTAQMFGYFMIIFNIAKIISGFMGISITPIYKKVTINNYSKSKSLIYLGLLGFGSLLLGLLSSYILPIAFIRSLIKVDVNDDLFRFWLTLGISYSFVIFMSSVYMNVVLIAFKKLNLFYYSRFLYIFIALTLVSINLSKSPAVSIVILIVSELTVIFVALVGKFRKSLSEIDRS